MLFPENQVIERNIEKLPAGKVLLVDLLQDDALTEFSAQRGDIEFSGYTPFFDTKNYFDSSKFALHEVMFGAWVEPEQSYDAIVIYYPKAKQRFDYYLSMFSHHLNAGGVIYAVGEKKGGVKSCDKALKPYCIKPNKIDAARHCMLFAAAYNGYNDGKFMADWLSETKLTIEVANEQIALALCALPGTFSANRLDEGTELLLKSIETVSGKGLDFGCGCGVISAALSKRFDVEMVGVEVDALSVAAGNETFKRNQVNAKAIASNGLSEVLESKLQFDFIATNPPFHTGIKTDYSITESLIKNLKSILKNRYQVWMVANHFLPYPELFKRYLKPVLTKNKNNRFHIYHTSN